MRVNKLNWNEWSPGLDTDGMTLAEVLATMPAAEQEDVPAVIRRYESPESPDALPGAISLARHDCIHVLLGRGLHVQDEAFVIGYTMGAASDITQAALETFIRVSTTEYPKHWRFEDDHIASYKLGVGFARDATPDLDIHLIELEGEPFQSMSVADLRRRFGLKKGEMRAYYRKEALLTPHTRASLRVDDCMHRPDRAISHAAELAAAEESS